MKNNHKFNVQLKWEKSDIDRFENPKTHSIQIEQKNNLIVSAAKTFKGDATKFNPEDLLLTSLTSCHMMSYFYCCQQAKIMLESYIDNSEAILQVNPDGSGKIVKVILRPVVTITYPKDYDMAFDLHEKASQLCFIANSCNFEITHDITIKYANSQQKTVE